MKSTRYLLNSCNSTSQFISTIFRCSCFLFCFFYQIKNFLFLLWVNLYMITGIYLHDPPPFLSLKKLWRSLCFHAPSPLLISDKSLRAYSNPESIRNNYIILKFYVVIRFLVSVVNFYIVILTITSNINDCTNVFYSSLYSIPLRTCEVRWSHRDHTIRRDITILHSDCIRILLSLF